MTTHSSVAQLPLEIGQQINLAGDPHPWTVKAVSEHFAALTRPLVAKDWPSGDREAIDATTAYTVLDWRNGVHGPCNLSGQSWGDGTYTEAECGEMVAEFESGELEISHRNNVRIEFGEVAW